MSENALILHPLDPFQRLPDHEQLVCVLREVGLVGEPSEHLQSVYKAGPRFLEWMSFESSHAVVELVNDGHGGLANGPVHDSRSICTLKPHYSEDGRPGPIVSCITEPPRCACSHTEEEWPKIVGQWYNAPGQYRWCCPSCGKATDPILLDWKHTAAFATDYLEIESIRPGEAMPSPELLAELYRRMSIQFGYVYYWL